MWEHKLVFLNKRGSNSILRQDCFSNQNFSSGKISLVSRNSFLIRFTIFNSTQNSSHQTQTFHHRTLHDIDKPHHGLHSTHHSKIVKMAWFWIETSFFMIWHESFNLHVYVSNLIFLVKISVLHMKLTVWLAWQVYQF